MNTNNQTMTPPQFRDQPDTLEFDFISCPKCHKEEYAPHGDVGDGQLLYVCQACSHSSTVLGTKDKEMQHSDELMIYGRAYAEYLDVMHDTLSDFYLEDRSIQKLAGEMERKIEACSRDESKTIADFKALLERCKNFMTKVLAAWDAAKKEGVKFNKIYLSNFIKKGN